MISLTTALLLAAAPSAECTMPAAIAPRVCTDPQLSKLERELAAREAQVLTASSRPATWAARAAEFRRWIANERGDDGKPVDTDSLAEEFREQIAKLDSEIARAASILPAADAQAALGTQCLATWLVHACTVPASGVLRGRDGLTIVWQLQSGVSEDDGAAMGAMLWDASAPGAPKLIGWTFEGVYMRAPQYNEKLGLLWVPGTREGTGEGNADILFQRRDGQWHEIETVSWRADLDRRLPKGFGAWHGIDYDFNGLGGQTDLWRDRDGNCCPTGGRAYLSFKLDGDAIALDTIQADIATGWKPSTEY